MTAVLVCIAEKHNIWLVLVAAFVCAAGSWAIMRLLHRAGSTFGLQRVGWHFLTAVAAGSSIWCTHFIAVLAYEPGAPVSFDPILTFISLLISMLGAAFGFVIATSRISRFAPLAGGACVGLAIAFMHYTGMLAYRIQGLVEWDDFYLVASIFMAVSISALAIHVAASRHSNRDTVYAAGIFMLAIVSLHFTGMAAMRVTPLAISGHYSNPDALQALALAIAGVALTIVGTGIASYLIDDSMRLESFEQLRRMALNDTLTGMANRASFNNYLEAEASRIDAQGGKMALVAIDLDNFKEVNDLRGHNIGDEVLKTLAQRMDDILKPGERIGRIGGDEFAGLHPIIDEEGLPDFIMRLEKALFAPISFEDFTINPRASLGIAIYPDDAANEKALAICADLAMYRAKVDLSRTFCFYENSMDEAIRLRRALSNELRSALQNNQLAVHFQVQTSVATGEIEGFEALLRWEHPQRGFIPPIEFIPIAEENGLILEMGEWVLRTACASAVRWQPGYKVAVNLSPVQFAHVDLPQLILEVLLDTGLPPERLELELTESTFFANKEHSLHMLRQIRSLGVSIALDDFGTGYSSLDTLRAFPFDKIKLDRSFMQEIETCPQARAILRAVLALGKSLEIPVLAEGIERAGQLELLKEERCDEAQGYLFGRPVTILELIGKGQIKLRPTDAGQPVVDIGAARELLFGAEALTGKVASN